MSSITISQALDAAHRAGFQGVNAQIAVAVAMAESGLNPQSIGDIDLPHAGCRSYGLWQINSCPDRDTSGCRADTNALLTVDGNAQCAFQVSGGSSFGPWTTFVNGAYKAFLGTVKGQDTGGTGTATSGGGLNGCFEACAQKYRSEIEASKATGSTTPPADYLACLSDCRAANGEVSGSNAAAGCAGCTGLDTIPECLSCAGTALSTGLFRIGVNVALGLVALIGLYLFFQDDVNAAVSKVAKTATEAAVA